jgi:predicted GNAT family acetyltransferase
MEPVVTNNPDEHRYEVRADGELAGFTVYRERPGLIVFVHTETDARFEGQGLGSALVRAALDDARDRGLEVLPFCPFVNGWIGRHAEYADLVPPAFRARFGLVSDKSAGAPGS